MHQSYKDDISLIRLGLWAFGKNMAEVKCLLVTSCQEVQQIHMTSLVCYTSLLAQVNVRQVFYCKVTIFPIPYINIWKCVTESSNPKGGMCVYVCVCREVVIKPYLQAKIWRAHFHGHHTVPFSLPCFPVTIVQTFSSDLGLHIFLRSERKPAHPSYFTLGRLFNFFWASVSSFEKWVSIEYLFLRVIVKIKLGDAYKVLITVLDR